MMTGSDALVHGGGETGTDAGAATGDEHRVLMAYRANGHSSLSRLRWTARPGRRRRRGRRQRPGPTAGHRFGYRRRTGGYRSGKAGRDIVDDEGQLDRGGGLSKTVGPDVDAGCRGRGLDRELQCDPTRGHLCVVTLLAYPPLALEDRGLLARREHELHSHVRELRLTGEGRLAVDAADAADAHVTALEADLIAELGHEDARLLRRLLERLAERGRPVSEDSS